MSKWIKICGEYNYIRLECDGESYIKWEDRKNIHLREERYERFNDDTYPLGYYFIRNKQIRTRKIIKEDGISNGVTQFTEWIDKYYTCDGCQTESYLVATIDDEEYYEHVKPYCLECLDNEIHKLKLLENMVVESEVKRISEETKMLRDKNVTQKFRGKASEIYPELAKVTEKEIEESLNDV